MSQLDSIDSVLMEGNDFTPEKLALMRLRSSKYDDDIFSEPDSPARYECSFDARNQKSGMARRSSQYVSSKSSNQANAFLSSHRSRMSMELSAQAESKFFGLMELMSSASREAGSLKEYWSRLVKDRQSFESEREELIVRLSELTEEMERKDSEHHHHHHEIDESKREIRKLVLQLSIAWKQVTELRKKLTVRDGEVGDYHRQIADLKSSYSRLELEHKNYKTETESKTSKTTVVETERDRARGEAEKHLGEYRRIYREHIELREKFTHASSQYETSRKEITTLKDKLRSIEYDRSSAWDERDRLQEELRMAKTRSEDYYRQYTEVMERYEHVQRELIKSKETARTFESRCDEYESTSERLRQENKDIKSRLTESETRYTDILVKYERARRDCHERDDRIRSFESELTEVRSRLDEKLEEYRLIVIERDQTRYELDTERERGGTGDSEKTHRVTSLEETLHKSESSLTQIRSELTQSSQRILEIERERDDARNRHGHLDTELRELREKLVLLQSEIKNTTHARDHALKDAAKWRREYESISQTEIEFRTESEEYQAEIESLSYQLSEAREQKERAIKARNSADRERDEFIAKYEEKCRQLEQFEKSRSESGFFSHGRKSGRHSSVRIFKRGSTLPSEGESMRQENGGSNGVMDVHTP